MDETVGHQKEQQVLFILLHHFNFVQVYLTPFLIPSPPGLIAKGFGSMFLSKCFEVFPTIFEPFYRPEDISTIVLKDAFC